MKKTYNLEDLECANCAAKMEEGINKLPGVTSATVSFITQKLILETETDDQSKLIKEIQKLIKKIEPDCRVIL
ncbi:MAG: heavy-metal-associated domain-containing protein [Clostridia bacterium]|nr:heavy-metal-associated domain-containing protein [Clostridia bacterium]